MASSYESLAKLNGEIRIYLDTKSNVDVHGLKAQLKYRYAYQREHLTATDPWEYAFADPRLIQCEQEFIEERDRVVEIFMTGLPSGWGVDVLYYAPGCASAIYHWSSTEGMLHYRMAEPDG